MPSFKRTASYVIAALTCPCHVPIYAVLLGGTALGGLIRENMGLVALGLTGVFVVSLMSAMGASKRREAEGDAADPPAERAKPSAQSKLDSPAGSRRGSS